MSPESQAKLPSAAELEAIAVAVALDGARVVRTAWRSVRVIATKSSPTDVVTDLDVEVERFMRTALHEHTPEASFVGEEQSSFAGSSPIGWVIDPIDGTVNLTYDLPVISVSLAATIDGAVVAGAVVDVLREEVFSAAAGRGARRDGSTIEPSRVAALTNALVGTGFAYSESGRASEVENFGRVLPAARDVRCFGSAALHLCWVACGRLDAYFQRDVKRWDYAAGALIAAESGALVDLPDEENGRMLVAASPLVFDPLQRLLH